MSVRFPFFLLFLFYFSFLRPSFPHLFFVLLLLHPQSGDPLPPHDVARTRPQAECCDSRRVVRIGGQSRDCKQSSPWVNNSTSRAGRGSHRRTLFIFMDFYCRRRSFAVVSMPCCVLKCLFVCLSVCEVFPPSILSCSSLSLLSTDHSSTDKKLVHRFKLGAAPQVHCKILPCCRCLVLLTIGRSHKSRHASRETDTGNGCVQQRQLNIQRKLFSTPYFFFAPYPFFKKRKGLPS